MSPARSLNSSFTILGFRLPVAVGLVGGCVLLASALGATAERNGVPIIRLLLLAPRAVWSGQVWRLGTWSLFELSPLSLLFAILMLGFFGRDLCYAWGGFRFLTFWVFTTVGTGGLVCLLLSLIGGDLADYAYATAWPVVEALVVAWALAFPSRVIFFNFVLPVSGTRLIWATLIMTFIGALLDGFLPFLPHFLAIGLSWVFFQRGAPSYWWLRFKAAWLVRRHSRHLRPVRRDGRAGPPNWLN